MAHRYFSSVKYLLIKTSFDQRKLILLEISHVIFFSKLRKKSTRPSGFVHCASTFGVDVNISGWLSSFTGNYFCNLVSKIKGYSLVLLGKTI